MSVRLNNKIIALLLIIGLQVLVSCSVGNSLPKNWIKDIAGVYEGAFSSYREITEFNTNGTFRHQVFEGGKMIIAEAGKWSVFPGKYEIRLEPIGKFTQFYDPMTRKFDVVGKDFGSYVYWPLPDGKTFSKISASPEYEYCLVRKSTRT